MSGAKLKELLKTWGWSQEKLARALDISLASVARWTKADAVTLSDELAIRAVMGLAWSVIIINKQGFYRVYLMNPEGTELFKSQQLDQAVAEAKRLAEQYHCAWSNVTNLQ